MAIGNKYRPCMAADAAGAGHQDGGGLLPSAPGQRAPCTIPGLHIWYGVIQLFKVYR